MTQALTNGYDLVLLLNEEELQRAIRQNFIETLAAGGLPAELLVSLDALNGMPAGSRLACRLGLPDSHIGPSRNERDGAAIVLESYPNALEIKFPFIDSALLVPGSLVGGLNLELSLIFTFARVSTNGGNEVFGLDPASLVVWVKASRSDRDPEALNQTTRDKLGFLLFSQNWTWTVFEQNLAEALKDQPFVANLASALPGLAAGVCRVFDTSPSSMATFDTGGVLQCFDFEVLNDAPAGPSLAIKGMLSRNAVSTTIGTPTDPLDLSWSRNGDRAVAIISNDYLLNEALPRAVMAALLDPLLTKREEQIAKEVGEDDDIASADREDEIERREDDMRAEVAFEYFSLRPFALRKSIKRNFDIPNKPEADRKANDSSIDRASISFAEDAFELNLHVTGGVAGLYTYTADCVIQIKFSASGGRVVPDIKAVEDPIVAVDFDDGLIGTIVGLVGLVTGVLTFGLGAIATFIVYSLAEYLTGVFSAPKVRGGINENLSDVDADLPEIFPLVVREALLDDLILCAEMELFDDNGLQWIGLTPQSRPSFRLDFDHGSPNGGVPDINRRFDCFTEVTAANADVEMLESGLRLRARNGALLFDLGEKPLGIALNVVQADIRAEAAARGTQVNDIQIVPPPDDVPAFLGDSFADWQRDAVHSFTLDNIESRRRLLTRVVGVVTDEGNVARLILLPTDDLTLCLYCRYFQSAPSVRVGLASGFIYPSSMVFEDEVTVEVTIPVDNLVADLGFPERPTEFTVKVGTSVTRSVFVGEATFSTRLLKQPLRSVEWVVTDANAEQVVQPGADRELIVSGAHLTFTISDDLRTLKLVSRSGDSGNFTIHVRVTDYRGTQATHGVAVHFDGTRTSTYGYGTVSRLMNLDYRLNSRELVIPERPGVGPDPSPQDPFSSELDGIRPSRDKRTSFGRSGSRDRVRQLTRAAVSRSKFNGPDPRGSLLQHLSLLSRQAMSSKSEAVIARAVEDWTAVILKLPDPKTLQNRKAPEQRNGRATEE